MKFWTPNLVDLQWLHTRLDDCTRWGPGTMKVKVKRQISAKSYCTSLHTVIQCDTDHISPSHKVVLRIKNTNWAQIFLDLLQLINLLHWSKPVYTYPNSELKSSAYSTVYSHNVWVQLFTFISPERAKEVERTHSVQNSNMNCDMQFWFASHIAHTLQSCTSDQQKVQFLSLQ